MMKRLALLCCMLIVLPAVLTAQDSGTRFGFGVTMLQDIVIVESEMISLPLNFNNLACIIRGENYRIEPRIGLLTYSYERTSSESNSETSASQIRLGVAAAYENVHGPMHYYYGLNIGFILESESSSNSYSTSGVDASKTDFFIGPLVGGEYMLNEDFSLGGEFQLNYIGLGEWEDSNDTNPSDVERSTSYISTRAMIHLRWYL